MLPNCHQHMSIHHFVELSPDTGATNKQKKRKKDKKSDWKISATCTRSVNAISSFPPLRAEENRKMTLPPMGPAVKLQLPVFHLSQRRKTGKSSLPPMRAAVKLKVPAFLLSQRRKPGKYSLPPVRAAVKLKLPAFLLSQRRKAGKCEFAAHASGGKAAWVSE